MQGRHGYLLPIGLIIVASLASLQAIPLLYGDYTWNLSSIEGAYIAQSRFLSENLPIPGWNPLWYGGHPFKLSYSPAFLWIVNITSAILNVSHAEAYRRVIHGDVHLELKYTVSPLDFFSMGYRWHLYRWCRFII